MNSNASASPRLTWGLIGTSGFADAVFAPAIVDSGQTLRGAAGSSAERSRAFGHRHECPRWYNSPAELLLDPEIDAVWVASPNHMHAEHVESALRAGKHVLAEKPLSTTAADAEMVAAIADQSGQRLAVGHQGRFHPANRELRELAQRGDFGDIAFIRASWQTRYPSLPGEWRLRPSTSGGWALMDIGTHLLDAVLWITGFPSSQLVGARLSTHSWDVEVDDHSVLLLRLGKTTGVVDAATGVESLEQKIEINGTRGWGVAINTFIPSAGPGRLITSTAVDRVYQNAPNHYEAEVGDFAAWTAGAEWPGATGSEGAINIAILEAARSWIG